MLGETALSAPQIVPISGITFCKKLDRQRAFIKTLPLLADGYLIREIESKDFEAFHEIASYPGFIYYRFDGTEEKTKQFVEEAISSRENQQSSIRKSFMFAVEEICSNKVIAHISADILPKCPDYYDLAYFVHPDYQKRGIARAVSKKLLEKMFKILEVDCVVATAHPENIASDHVLRWLGGEETGEECEVESADGRNKRKCYRIENIAFMNKHHAPH